MTTKYDDQLAIAHLALIDMERVQKSIEYLLDTEDRYLKAALFRDAVVSYAKPFSDNRYCDERRGLRISSDHVPRLLVDVHKEVLALRNELVAHTDMAVQRPKIDKYGDDLGLNYSLNVSGYEILHKDHLIKPLLELARAVHGSLIRGRSEQTTKNDFLNKRSKRTIDTLEKRKMNLEILFFRAFLVVSVSSLLGFFGLSTYYSNAATNWGEIAEQNFKTALEHERDCEGDMRQGRVTSSCKMAESWTKTYRESLNVAEVLTEKSDTFFIFSYLVPLSCAFLFYGGRWSILGRLRPLWPLTTNSKS